MEAEKAKEKEELMSQKFNEFHKRLEALTSDCLEQKNLNATLQADLAKEEELNETFKEVINKFYEIRQQAVGGFEDKSWDDKCACLLQDPVEMWSFNDTSTSKYISALEDELEKMKSSAESLQSKLLMGLEIENHLKKSVRELEMKIFCSNKFLINGIVELRHFHSQHKVDIMNLLDEGRSHIISISDMIQENIQQFDVGRGQNTGTNQRDENLDAYECHDVHISTDANTSLVSKMKGPGLSDAVAERKGDTSEALALALQEKVAALLLLSQQEERHLLEKNVNVALQMKIEELQRNLLQVTNEKVKALVELAQLKQEYHLLQEKISYGKKQGKDWAEIGESRLVTPDRDGRLRNLLKKTYLRRWIGAQDLSGQETQARLNNAGDMTARSTSSMDFARMKIENATLKESMESMEHLTSSVHRLRLSLSKVKESATSEGTVTTSMFEALDEIVTEAKLIKTALGSSLPLRFEMVELVILASQILKDSATKRGHERKSTRAREEGNENAATLEGTMSKRWKFVSHWILVMIILKLAVVSFLLEELNVVMLAIEFSLVCYVVRWADCAPSMAAFEAAPVICSSIYRNLPH
ncbi:hypothetical protein Patl1_37372 [Pistacia atlantica]|nr:hypothetical protein Patl1_37372 [Pistacia atlantica]